MKCFIVMLGFSYFFIVGFLVGEHLSIRDFVASAVEHDCAHYVPNTAPGGWAWNDGAK